MPNGEVSEGGGPQTTEPRQRHRPPPFAPPSWASDSRSIASYASPSCRFGVYAPKRIGDKVKVHLVLVQFGSELREGGLGARSHFAQGRDPIPFGILNGAWHLVEQHGQ